MKTISVIIPTHNRARYLEQLLIQLSAQRQPPEEIIVVDDHSTDDTKQMVQRLATQHPRIRYVKNQGKYQRDAKATGLTLAHKQFIGFLDDDVCIDDQNFFVKLRQHLSQHVVVQAKVILEQMGQRNILTTSWRDALATRPYPVLELITTRLNAGSKIRNIFPLIEFGNFWPKSLQHYFIDQNLILDDYGESYAAALRLYRNKTPMKLVPNLVIRHPGADTGGSKRFDKRNMLRGFTQFHCGYFTNMIYLHARFYRAWVWLWLPFFLTKATIALVVNRDIRGFFINAVRPIFTAVRTYFIKRQYV